MLTHFENRNIVFAPFVLPQNNWSFDSGKTNGVMPAVNCHCRKESSGNEDIRIDSTDFCSNYD